MVKIEHAGCGFSLLFSMDGARGWRREAASFDELVKALEHYYRPDGAHHDCPVSGCPLCREREKA